MRSESSPGARHTFLISQIPRYNYQRKICTVTGFTVVHSHEYTIAVGQLLPRAVINLCRDAAVHWKNEVMHV